MNADKDFKVFASNVRLTRLRMGWTMQELADRAGISIASLIRIQRGCVCLSSTQTKLANAFSTSLDTLWFEQPAEPSRFAVIKTRDARWQFADPIVAKDWALNKSGQIDPDEIQNVEERMRLGRLGLSNSFVQRIHVVLTGERCTNLLVEVYAFVNVTNIQTGMNYFCVRGDLVCHVEGQAHELHPGDIFVVECGVKHTLDTVHPLGRHELPPSSMCLW